MKKQFLFIIFFLFVSPPFTHAQTLTETPAPTAPEQKVTEKLNTEINALKDRIASRVAQLNLVEKRGVIGTVKEAEGTKITLTDLSGNERLVDVDEITKFSSGSSKKTDFGISDITPGSIIRVLGNYNKDSKRILARFVDVLSLPQMVNGVVSNISKSDFTITVLTNDKKQIIVDIENITKTSTYTDTDDVVKVGFSKIKTGERVHVTGYPDKKEKNRISATRILLLPELKVDPKIDTANITIQPTDTLVPTKASTILKKATPTP